jgi:Putative  PD-(D/E)XK family member, (DUF4420)
MSSPSLVPAWSTVRFALEAGAPKRYGIAPKSRLFLQVDPSARWLGLLVPWRETDQMPVSPLREIKIASRTIDDDLFLSVGTDSRELFQQCYSFLLTVADAIDGGQPAALALAQELKSWEALLKPAARLTKEDEIGLFGELWTLHRLISFLGSNAIEGWVAIDTESHDFRFGNVDLEVKTTVSNERLHFIHSLAQVVPLDGHALYLLSIQIAPAGIGNGLTLPEAILVLHSRFNHDPNLQSLFNRVIETRGYRQSDAAQYPTRFRLRRGAALIPVDASFPAVTPAAITRLLGPDRASRTDRFQYMVKLDGLGFGDGSPEFVSIIPVGESGNLL